MKNGFYPPGGPVEVHRGEGPMFDDLRYPGHGYLPRQGEDRPALSEWGRLSRGGALGKKANLLFSASGTDVQSAKVPILQIEGDDADARQVVVTLGNPLVIPQPFSALLGSFNPQNLTGEQDNAQIQDRPTFPGTVSPIAWPPIEAIVEWGVGGTSGRARIDFVCGSTIAVVASYLRVHAAIVKGSEIDISGTSAMYTLSAFVGPGFGVTRAQKTVYVGEVGSLAESAVFAIPAFARDAYVVGCDPAAGPAIAVTVATLRMWQSPDGVAGGNNVGNFFVAGNQPDRFPIPAGAAYASVFNAMAIPVRFAIVYNLAI